MTIKLDDLEDKWRIDSPDEPPCASCGRIIDGPFEVPLRFFRNGGAEELALCPECLTKRQVSD